MQSKDWSVCYITDNLSSNKDIETVMPVEVASFSFLRGHKYCMLLDWASILYAMWRANCRYYVIKTPAYLLVPMRVFTWLFRRKLVFWAQMEFDAWPELRPLKRVPGMLQDFGTRQADIILAQNNSQVKGFRRNFGKQASLIRNIAGDLSELLPGSNDNLPQVDILWVGNSMAKKRVEVVLALAQRLPSYSFAIAMNRADADRYNSIARQCEDMGNVRFLGEVNPVDMEAWFGVARLLLNTSRQEGFPNTYLQAWQHGVPVVSVCIDPDSVVAERELGAVLDVGLTEELEGDEGKYAEMLEPLLRKFLDDDLLYDRYASRVRVYVDEYHSEDVLVNQLISILQSG